MSCSGLAKLLIGVFLGVAILASAGVGAGYYFFTQMSIIPSPPVFSEERPKKPTSPAKSSPTATKKAPAPLVSPKTEPTPKESATPKLEPGAYKARITWREGLILREKPSSDANAITSIPYNQQITVIKESDDKVWQQVRIEETNQEGWIRSGNIEKTN
jgi:hypothetical protein